MSIPGELRPRIEWRQVSKGRLKAFYVQGGQETELKWFPQSGSQTAFLRCPLLEVIYVGTRGPGKTDALLMSFLQYVAKGFGSQWNGILFRRTYKELEDVEQKAARIIHGDKPLFPKAKFNSTTHTWKFSTGEVLRFRHLKRDQDAEIYQGHEYPWIGFEELTHFPSPGPYLTLFGCCRSANPDMPRMIRATSNPHGPGHNWVKKRFGLNRFRTIKGGHGGGIADIVLDEESRTPRVGITGHFKENRILMLADPDYESRLLIATSKNINKREAWLNGSWQILSGGMFDDLWDPDVHIVTPFRIPNTWRIDRSFDWGSSAPFSVGWWAESNGEDIELSNGVVRSTVRGDLYRIHEWYGAEENEDDVGLRFTSSEITKGIVERELRWGLKGRVRPGPADSSIWNADRGDSIADEMERPIFISGTKLPGVRWERANKSAGSRKMGWQLIRSRMQDSLPFDEGGNIRIREAPGIFVFANCRRFLDLVPYSPRSEADPDEIADGMADHMQDEVRYRVLAGASSFTASKTVGFQ